MDHLLEPMHRLPKVGTFGVDRCIIHQQLVLAVGEARQDRRDVALRALILTEIVLHLVAEGNEPK